MPEYVQLLGTRDLCLAVKDSQWMPHILNNFVNSFSVFFFSNIIYSPQDAGHFCLTAKGSCVWIHRLTGAFLYWVCLYGIFLGAPASSHRLVGDSKCAVGVDQTCSGCTLPCALWIGSSFPCDPKLDISFHTIHQWRNSPVPYHFT